MDLDHVTQATTRAALESEHELAGRVLVVYLAPDGGGMWIHRVGFGSVQVMGADADFAESCDAALSKLWPELAAKTRLKLKIAADLIGRTPVAKMIAGAVDDE